MPGRNRRLRLLAFSALVFFGLLIYTRNSRHVESYQDYFGDKLQTAGVGGGSVLRPSLEDIPPQQERYPVPHDPDDPDHLEPVIVWVDPPEDEPLPEGWQVAEEQKPKMPLEGPALPPVKENVAQAPLEDRPAVKAPSPASPPSDDVDDDGDDYDDGIIPKGANMLNDPYGEGQGQGRLAVDEDEDDDEDENDAANEPTVTRWHKQKEYYPIKTTIPLPSGTSKPFPKIQRAEKKLAANGADKSKLAIIQSVAEHAWDGYRQVAFGADEAKPVSGGPHNPFNGWGATLVDSLDTLWIMGMKDEFEEAVKKVAEIDFTTSKRKDIPVFETTIRYMGGLLGAYDVSGRKSKYGTLLEKAQQLGEILYSAFDTPNRMPQTYYKWAPQYATDRHRAGSRTVMAELGSMSVEFTRLAQLTGQPKYYDAVARITDALEEYQNQTRLPGMWPTTLDASGCGLTNDSTPVQNVHSPLEVPGSTGEQMVAGDAVQGFSSAKQTSPKSALGAKTSEDDAEFPKIQISGNKGSTSNAKAIEIDDAAIMNLGAAKIRRDEAALQPESRTDGHIQKRAEQYRTDDNCVPQGIISASETTTEKFTLSGMSDSTYEYLPKEYMLLGGLAEQYKDMYLFSAETVIQNLLYKPMTIDERDILMSGELQVKWNNSAPKDSEWPYYDSFTPEVAHLACFAGGMFAMGGVIFDRPEHVEIGSKLTDGCVWAYNVTATGIMPEGGTAMQCPDTWADCPWDQQAYWDVLVPYKNTRPAPVPKTPAAAPPKSAAALDVTGGSLSDETVTKPKTPAKPDLPGSPNIPLKPDIPVKPASPAKPETPIVIAPDNAADLTVKGDRVAGVAAKPAAAAGGGSRFDAHADVAAGAPAKASSATNPTNADIPRSELDEEDGPQLIKRTTTGSEAETPTDVLHARTPPLPPTTVQTEDEDDEEEDTPSQAYYVAKKIKHERLPPGFTHISGKRYLLRPEAIESVFYMYRITGDNYWREVGWNMFSAVEKWTRADFGASAIDDTTREYPSLQDSQESFWFAETLKYFYLLYDDPAAWSLDEWVLNTEAHFFKRPPFKAIA